MNEKKIILFANAIQKLIVYLTKKDQPTCLRDEVYNFTSDIYDPTQKLRNCEDFNLNIDGEVKELISLIDDTKFVLNTKINNLLDKLNVFIKKETKKQDIISIEDIVVELKDLQSQFDNCIFLNDSRKKSIIVTTRSDIILDGYNFGKYDIILDLILHKVYDKKIISIIIAEQSVLKIKFRSKKAECYELIHPHVTTGEICFGNSFQTIKNALLTGRIKDLFVLIETFLKSYNEDTCYEPVDYWKESEFEEDDE